LGYEQNAGVKQQKPNSFLEPFSKIGFWFKIAAGLSFSSMAGFSIDFIILRGIARVAGFPV